MVGMKILSVIGISSLAVGCIFLILGVIFYFTNQQAIEIYRNTPIKPGSNVPFLDLPCAECYAWIGCVLAPTGISMIILTRQKPQEKTLEEIEKHEMKTLFLSIIISVGILVEGNMLIPVPY